MAGNDRILVVDDEAVCTFFLDAALSEAGYSVRSTTRADVALDLARTFSPEVLITDWMLKDNLDGVDLAKILRSENPSIKIIFITGMSAKLLAEQASEVTDAVILEKPLDLGLVTETIEEALDNAAPAVDCRRARA